MQFEEAVKQFLRHLELERGCTSCTVQAYTSDLRIFLKYLGEAGIEPDSGNVSTLVMRRYVSWLVGNGYRPASVSRRVSAVSSMWKWLVGYEYETVNPCAGLVLPKKGRRLPAVLTTEEARRVLAAADDHTNVRTAFRNRAIMHVLLFCGLRRQELLDLRLADVDLRSRWLKVRNGKGQKGRSVPLVPEAAMALQDWLEFRAQVNHDYLFTGIGGARLGKNGLIGVFKLVSGKAGILRKGVSLHTLRHTFASLLVQYGCDLMSIKEALGHSDLSTTSIYLHLDAAHLQEALTKHPLSSGFAEPAA
ncbi:MAG: tyrosine-type recombinase/integrase [Armatimonadota bacterium]